MKIKLTEIHPVDISFRKDILGIQKPIDNLTKLLLNSEYPFILSINAPWGTGKTTFVNYWQEYLKSKNVFTYHFNAWENDYTKDAFASVLSEFKRLVEANPLTKKSAHFESVISNSKKVLKIGLPLAARMITMGALDLDKITEKTISEFWEKVVSEKLKEYETAKEDLLSFKNSLSEATKAISEEHNNYPIFIFIDELDRCKPTFAIELLEVIKHFFNIDNICIILSIDKTQLSESIKSIYGNGFNAVEYLKRFIDLEYTLEIQDYANIVNMYIEKYEFESFFANRSHTEFKDEEKTFQDSLKFLFNVYRPTLRDIEKIFTIISIALKTTNNEQYFFPVPVLYLSFLKVMDISKYKIFIEKTETDITLLKQEYEYYNSIPAHQRDYPIPTYIEFQLDIFLSENGSIRKKIEQFEEISKTEDDERLDYYLRLSKYANRSHGNIKKYILEKLDFTGNFVIP